MASATLLRIALPCHCHCATPCHFATSIRFPRGVVIGATKDRLRIATEGLFGLARIRKYAWTWMTAQRRLARCSELPPSHGNERIGQP